MAICEVFSQLSGQQGVLIQGGEPLHVSKGKRTVVTQGVYVSPQTGAIPVALKTVDLSLSIEALDPATRAIRHEFEMLTEVSQRTLDITPHVPYPYACIPPYDVQRMEEGGVGAVRVTTLVMSLLPESLQNHLNKEQDKRFSVEKALRVTREILYALENLQQVGHAAPERGRTPRPIIQADVKPANIALSESEKVTLMDFGVSEHATAEEQDFISATLAYMDPDQLKQTSLGRSIDWRTDIYATGLVLFEMLSGTSLFKLLGKNEFIRAVVDSTYQDKMVEALEGRVDSNVLNFLLTLTHPDRNQRFQNAYRARLAVDQLVSPVELPKKEIKNLVVPERKGLAARLRSLFSSQ